MLSQQIYISKMVIRGRQRSLEGQTLDAQRSLEVIRRSNIGCVAAKYSLCFQLSLHMHKAMVKNVHFGCYFRSLKVVRGHQKIKHWIRCCYYIPWVPRICLICIKPQLKHFYLLRSLEVIKIQFYFILGNSITNQACSQKIGRCEPKMKEGTPPLIRKDISTLPFGPDRFTLLRIQTNKQTNKQAIKRSTIIPNKPGLRQTNRQTKYIYKYRYLQSSVRVQLV